MLERIGNQSIFVRIDRQVTRLVRVEGLNRTKIRRIFHDDVIARIEKDLPDEIESLLRSIDDSDAIGIEDSSETARQSFGEPNAHFGNALGHAVLKRGGTVALHHRTGGLCNRSSWEELGRRQTAAEGNYVGLLRDLQHLT